MPDKSKERLTRVVGGSIERHVGPPIECEGPPDERPRYQRSWKYFESVLVENLALELALDLFPSFRDVRLGDARRVIKVSLGDSLSRNQHASLCVSGGYTAELLV